MTKCGVQALDMLQAITRVVGGRLPILMDGGIRRGTDMLKARLCLPLNRLDVVVVAALEPGT